MGATHVGRHWPLGERRRFDAKDMIPSIFRRCGKQTGSCQTRISLTNKHSGGRIILELWKESFAKVKMLLVTVSSISCESKLEKVAGLAPALVEYRYALLSFVLYHLRHALFIMLTNY